MKTLKNDIQYALRQLVKNPGFAAVTVLTLGLGVGLNTAIFSVMNGVLLRPLPYANGDRIVHLGYREPGPDVDSVQFSFPELEDYRKQSRTFASVMEYYSMPFTLVGAGEPDSIRIGYVDTPFFDEIGVQPLLGRTFRPEDGKPGASGVAVLTHEYWQRRFGGDGSVLGKTYRINDQPVTVVGVLPRLPKYPGEESLYMASATSMLQASEVARTNRNFRVLNLFARLRPEVTLEQARADVATVAARMRQEYPEAYQDAADFDVPVVAVREELTYQFRPTILALAGMVGLVLLIACSNVANLHLARLIKREREIVVRAALGAGRGRLIQQMLTESVVLALLGGLLGLLLAYIGVDLLVAFSRHFTARVDEIGIDGPVLLFNLAVSLGAGLLCGLIPAYHTFRQNLAAVLKEGAGRATAGGGKHRFRSALVVAQVAVSFILLIGAGLTVRSLLKLQRVDAGFNSENVLTSTIPLPLSKYGIPGAKQFYATLLERIEAYPDVVSTAVGSSVPLTGNQMAPTFIIEGRPVDPGQPEPRADIQIASEGYFRTLGIPLLKGRTFTRGDDDAATGVTIINQALARHYFDGQDPIGKRMALTAHGVPGEWRTIIGVVGDVKQAGLGQEGGAAFYRPYLQAPAPADKVLVRTSSDPAALAQAIRNIVHELDPEQPVADLRTLAQVRSESVAPSRMTASLAGLFAALAFAITAIGISGIVGFTVTERTQEIGIRSALGARRGALLGLVLRQSLLLVAVGLVLGAMGSLWLTRLIQSLLFGVEPTDPLTFVGVSLLLVLIVGAACLWPARRAATVDPLVALRSDG
ncbi:MAG TPA: ABC transporter permease [Thermoanaerobaculia bacterium]|nr:ABC transporter permease [Thermoanaerobaculia bacterium]